MQLDGFSDVSDVLRCGVYALGYRGKIVYIGKSKTMLNRIYTHRSLRSRKVPSWMVTKGILFDEVHICPCGPDRIDELERQMIDRYRPRYNTYLKSPEPIRQEIKLSVGGVEIGLNSSQPALRRV